MLYLIGLGLWDESDVSLRAVEACRRCAKVYCELYTAAWGGDIERLGRIIGKKIDLVTRTDVEDKSDKLIGEAGEKDVALLVPGDPLTATTHVHLAMECVRKKIEFQVIHSSSIYTAVAKTGLQLYKFGRTATVITPAKGYESSGFFEAIAENRKLGLHTLLLLDRDMGTKQAIALLKAAEAKGKKKILKEAVVCSALGSEHERIVCGKFAALAGIELPPPAVVIIPGKLHFMEREFLEALGK